MLRASVHSVEYQDAQPTLRIAEADSGLRQRLYNAYQKACNYNAAQENLKKTVRFLRRHGVAIDREAAEDQSGLISTLNGKRKHDVTMQLEGSAVPLRGIPLLVAIAYLYNVEIVYFSTRKRARIIRPPEYKRTVGVLQHVDSFMNKEPEWFLLTSAVSEANQFENTVNEKCPTASKESNKAGRSRSVTKRTTPAAKLRGPEGDVIRRPCVRTNVDNATIKDAVVEEFGYHLEREYKAILDASKGKGLRARLQKFEKKEKGRRQVPRVYSTVQAKILQGGSGVGPSWLGDRIKAMKDFDALKIYKEKASSFIAEKMKLCEQDDDEKEDEDEKEEDEDENEEQKQVEVKETFTFTLRSILRPEIDYDDMLQKLETEQERVSRCMTQLNQGIMKLTELIANGTVADLCGYPRKSVGLDLRKIAPAFDFGDKDTQIDIAPIEQDETMFLDNRIYTFEHFSNILSGE